MATTQQRPASEGSSKGTGLLKGLGVTLKHFLHRSVTQQYPHEKPDLPARTRGVIALKEANCTVCYKCSRACPDWCIYIDAHKETHEPAGGGKARSAKILDRFAIDYSLCMYCGICVEVCPFDALFWSPEYEYAEFDVRELVHEKERLESWVMTVLPPPELETDAEPEREGGGAETPAAKGLEPASASAPPPGTGVTGGGAVTEEGSRPLPDAVTAPPPPTGPKVEVEPDQAVYDETLAVELAKGTAERVAIGKAKRAAMMAAKKAAQGEGVGVPTPEAKSLEPSSAATPTPTDAGTEGGGAPVEPGSRPSPDEARAPSPPTSAKVEVEPDQAVYDETLAAELAKGTPERVAIGKAKRAAIIAARKKAQG